MTEQMKLDIKSKIAEIQDMGTSGSICPANKHNKLDAYCQLLVHSRIAGIEAVGGNDIQQPCQSGIVTWHTCNHVTRLCTYIVGRLRRRNGTAPVD